MGIVVGRYEAPFESVGDSEASQSALERLLQANLDIKLVARDEVGAVNIVQQIPNGDNYLLTVSVSKHWERPQALYPDVTISGQNFTRNPIGKRSYIVLLIADDGSITVEKVPDRSNRHAIPPEELVNPAKRALDLLAAAIDDPTYQFEKWNSYRDSRVRDFYNPQKLRRDAAAGAEYLELPGLNRLIKGIDDAGSHVSFARDAIQRALEDTTSWEQSSPSDIG